MSTLELFAACGIDKLMKIKDYEKKGYELVEGSEHRVSYFHGWKMQLRDGLSEPIEVDDTSAEKNKEDSVEGLTADTVIVDDPLASTDEPDFLPDWDKIEGFLKDNSEKDAKKLFRDYADGFGIKLNIKKNFTNMKKDFTEAIKAGS